MLRHERFYLGDFELGDFELGDFELGDFEGEESGENEIVIAAVLF